MRNFIRCVQALKISKGNNAMARISHVLPPLAQNTHLQQLDAAGRWEAISDNSLLLNIARGLRVVSQQANDRYLVSVPDVWARTEIVRSALFNNEHRLHHQVTKEWRGLLALIALAPYHGYNLTSELVQLSELERSPYDAETGEIGKSGNSNLGSVIKDLMPIATLAEKQSWAEIALLRCNGEPIGLIVPSTIVCTSRNIGRILNDLVPWCTQGVVNDPCQTINVQSDEFASLKTFLEAMLQNIKDDGTDVNLVSGISNSLNSYINACDEKFKELAGDQTGIFGRLSPMPTNFSLPQQPIYSVLSNVFAIDWGSEEHYDTLIECRKEFIDSFKGALVADENMAHTADRHPARIKIWKNHSLQTYIDTPSYRDGIESDLADSGYILVDPSKLFTDRLCHVDGDLYFTTHAGNGKSFILPLDPKILLFYSAEEINNRTKLIKTGRGYKVTFRLTLKRSDGESWDHAIEKNYSEDTIVSRSIPDSVSQWPNFSHPDWSWYFFYFAGFLPIHFSPRALFSFKEVREFLDASPDFPSRIRSVQDFGDQYTQKGRRLGLVETQVLTEMYLLKSIPEAMICDAALGSEVAGYVPTKDRTLLGLLLLPSPSHVQTSTRNASVGIDFGTTNTSAYVKIQNDKSTPMSFEDRIVSPVVASSSSSELSNILRGFFPHEKVGVPFMTILRDRDLSEFVADVFPAWNSHIYYVGDVVSAIEDLIRDQKHTLRFNLKWSRDPSDRQLVRQYMAQVVLQCLAELFSSGIRQQNVSWKFAHPEAFPPSQLEDFIAICSSATKMALSPDPEAVDFAPKIQRQSESLSTALYFISEKRAYMVQNAVTIDIGGHTSDISIWQSRNLIWRNSLEVAGRHIFIDYLKQNIGLLESLAGLDKVMAEGLAQLKELGDDDFERFGYGIEILVNSETFSKAFERDFELIGGVKEGGLLKQLSLVALSGILFYTGLTMRHLFETGAMEKLPNTHISVCLGGRGSLIYNAIFKDGVEDVREKEGILKLFCDTIGDGIESASFIFSSHHKHEVAYGLLVDPSGDRDLDLDSKRSSAVLVGEKFKIGPTKILHDTLVSEIPRNGEWRLDEVDTIKELLSLLSQYLKIRVDIDRDKAAKNDLIGRVNSQLVGAQDRMNKEAHIVEKLSDQTIVGESEVIEPVFVIALRSLLEQIVANKIDVEYLSD